MVADQNKSESIQIRTKKPPPEKEGAEAFRKTNESIFLQTTYLYMALVPGILGQWVLLSNCRENAKEYRFREPSCKLTTLSGL